MRIGDRIRHARMLVDGLSGRELSMLAGASRSVTWQIESGGIKDLGTDLASRFAEALGVSLEWLVRGIGEEPRAEAVRAAVEAARARRAAPPPPEAA